MDELIAACSRKEWTKDSNEICPGVRKLQGEYGSVLVSFVPILAFSYVARQVAARNFAQAEVVLQDDPLIISEPLDEKDSDDCEVFFS